MSEVVKVWKELDEITYDKLIGLIDQEVKGYSMKGEFTGVLMKGSMKEDSIWIASDDLNADNPLSVKYTKKGKYTFPVIDDKRRRSPHIQKIELAVAKSQIEAQAEEVSKVTSPIKKQLDNLYNATADIYYYEQQAKHATNRRDLALAELTRLTKSE